MMMNFEQQKALAKLLHTIRGDWDVEGCMTALGRARDAGRAGDVRAIVDASVAAALDARNRTPAVIPLAGAHWSRPDTPQAARPWAPQRACGICSLDEVVCRSIASSGHAFVPYGQVVREALDARARRAGGV